MLATTPITSSKFFHCMTNTNINTLSNIPQSILKPTNFNITPNCGFKAVGFVKRRCKDCYMVKRQNRLYNICEKHPRHKQMQIAKKPKNTWILTHATQSKIRPW